MALFEAKKDLSYEGVSYKVGDALEVSDIDVPNLLDNGFIEPIPTADSDDADDDSDDVNTSS